jgi:hypothetical protein
MSKQDDLILNSKIHIATLCKSFGYDGMAYRKWIDHGLTLDADNNISISEFNAWIKDYLTKDDDMDFLKAEKLRKEIEQIEIKNSAARAEYYSRSIVDSTIGSIFKITKDRVLQLDKTIRVYTAPDQQQAKIILREISREILTDIESGIRTLANEMQTVPQQPAQSTDQINSTDNNTNSANTDDTNIKPKKPRGRPKAAV